MGTWKEFGRLVSGAGIALCVISAGWSVASAQQPAAPAQPSLDQSSLEQTSSAAPQPQLPDSPGSARANLPLLAQQQAPAGPSQSTSASSGSQDQVPPLPQAQQQPAPQKPVGTAAAEPTHASGIAASQPAGVAVAPAKQRRVRTIVIRTAAIIGAAAAVGTVVALTEATSSKPPGAH